MKTKRWVTAVLAAAVVPMTGCTGSDDFPENKNANSLGTHAELGPIKLRNVYVAAPDDGLHEPGERAVILLSLINTGDRPDRLLSVTSPMAGEIQLRWDSACDGTAEPVDSLPLTRNGSVPAPADRNTEEHLPYYLAVTAFSDTVRAGTTMPLTFRFAEAGEISVDAKAQADHPSDKVGSYACAVTPTAQ